MFKITVIAALVALVSACSSMPGSMSGSDAMNRTTMGAPGTGMGTFNPNGGGTTGAF